MKKTFLFFPLLINIFSIMHAQQKTIYVSPEGNDKNSGALEQPLKTLQAALKSGQAANELNIELRAGTYYLDTTLNLEASPLKKQSLTISAYKNEKVTISGARKIIPKWKIYKGEIMQSFIGKGLDIDQLYCNGTALPMARYPNYNSKGGVFNGTAEDAISKERVRKWKDPTGGYIHTLHAGEWGSFHFRITSVDAAGELKYEGGWQNNRPSPMHAKHRFVENIFEELDTVGEWYYNSEEGTLFLYPPVGIKITNAVFEYAALDGLISINGDSKLPVENITIRGIRFTQTARTFMKTKEPLLRSDWCIFRGGAILIEGGKNISIEDCNFEQLGGNAVFVSNYNRQIKIEGNHIHSIGGNAIAFVGDPHAVRSSSFLYEDSMQYDKMDWTPGPASDNYPAQCTAYNNLIHDIGQIEKQVAGVEISMSSEITVSHNTIYNVPRSGINIGDGCWGGHIIEFNDVFNTVLETGDHGAFNSWGRDRYWTAKISTVDSLVSQHPDRPLADVIKPITLRNNRFHCTHGWDIDLDDGSSNYHIYNNVCLNGGLKLREGFNRIAENNILINNTFHPHVWYKNSHDIFRYNIVSTDYAPIRVKQWGDEVDSNFFFLPSSLEKARANGTDKHSKAGEVAFSDPAHCNYTVAANSPVFETGFKNFPMNEFGVVTSLLKALAEKPPVPDMTMLTKSKPNETFEWLGATIKNVETLGERSAAGLYEEKGILVLSVAAGSLAAKSGLQERDVILKIRDSAVNTVSELYAAVQSIQWIGGTEAVIFREHKEEKIDIYFK
jgi:hypothetical protein